MLPDGGLKAAQGGVYPLCQRADVTLLVDRSPATGELRGLLCAICTYRLGFVEEADWVEQAQSYITDPIFTLEERQSPYHQSLNR